MNKPKYVFIAGQRFMDEFKLLSIKKKAEEKYGDIEIIPPAEKNNDFLVELGQNIELMQLASVMVYDPNISLKKEEFDQVVAERLIAALTGLEECAIRG